MGSQGIIKNDLCLFLKTYALGKGNCITASKLNEIFGGNSADVRAVVNALRIDGEPICSCCEGYYYPVTKSEVIQTIQSLESRIVGICKAVNGLRGVMDDFS
jgi:hypothetical protein